MAKLAPFDHLIVTCAVEKIDDRLLSQVRLNGTCGASRICFGRTKIKNNCKTKEKRYLGRSWSSQFCSFDMIILNLFDFNLNLYG